LWTRVLDARIPGASGEGAAIAETTLHRHLDRSRRRQHLAGLTVTVVSHQAAATLASELSDVGIDLGLQRLGQHPPSTLTHYLIDQRRRDGAGFADGVAVRCSPPAVMPPW
jgi:hypothetical protein